MFSVSGYVLLMHVLVKLGFYILSELIFPKKWDVFKHRLAIVGYTFFGNTFLLYTCTCVKHVLVHEGLTL